MTTPRAAIQSTDGYEWFTEYDDGPATLGQTWELIRAELAAGVRDIVEPGATAVRFVHITDPAADAYDLGPDQFTIAEELDATDDDDHDAGDVTTEEEAHRIATEEPAGMIDHDDDDRRAAAEERNARPRPSEY